MMRAGYCVGHDHGLPRFFHFIKINFIRGEIIIYFIRGAMDEKIAKKATRLATRLDSTDSTQVLR